MNYLFLTLLLSLLSVSSHAATVTWKCNTETDMKEYRAEYTNDAGATYKEFAVIPQPKPCLTSVTYKDARPITPGKEMFRVFAVDTTDKKSLASLSAPAAPPPPVAVIGNIPLLTITNITTSTATATYKEPSDGLGGLAQSNIRYSVGDMFWGSAANAICSAGVCQLSGLPADSTISVMGIGYLSQPTGGSKFGAFSPIATFRTAKAEVPLSPPPVPTVTLKQVLRDSFRSCKTKRLTLPSCLTLLDTAIGKVTEP